MLARLAALALVPMLLASCGGARSTAPRPRPRVTAVTAGTPALRARDPYAGDPTRTDSARLVLGGTLLTHPTPYIPPQCYTNTRDEAGGLHNPCYACHVEGRAPNFVRDADLQLAYSFPEPARENPWENLFEDRRARVDATTDDEVLAYVRSDNYGVDRRGERLASRLHDLPAGWDVDGDGTWGGYVPDAQFRFDERGFDVGPGGEPTGWRAFGYYPFLGTFFPTNGSTDDVLIRLPQAFRSAVDGSFDRSTYETNLAIVEALVRREDVRIEPTDERAFGVDLDRDARLGIAQRVAYAWDPPHGVTMTFVGLAGSEQAAGRIIALAGLFPSDTEFLHSVRYLDVDAGGVRMAARMKELRYARKARFYGYGELEQMALHEAREDREEPDRAREIVGNAELGVSNGIGWVYQGFIEDARGELRPQTFEEHAACVGCHGGIGATTDGVFAFPRRLGFDSFQRGWAHATQHSLAGMADPRRADGSGEYATYLRANRAGDELRGNTEVIARFFDADGRERPDAFRRLARDVTVLLYPGRERALALDKAYLAIVRAQSFRRGRDATSAPTTTVHRSVAPDATTGLTRPLDR